MNRNIHGKHINKESLVQFSKYNDSCKVLRPVPTKADNTSNVIDYKDISLSLTGEVSSTSIHRNNLTQKQHDSSFIETAEEEEDDEEFFLNIKRKIDQNCNLRNNENYNLRDLQSKSYSAKKRKCALSDEAQDLMKRFKSSSVNESKQVCKTPQKLQPRCLTFDRNITTMKPSQITPPVTFNNINNAHSENDTNRVVFVTSTAQRNNAVIASESANRFITEAEIEQLVYCEMQCFTPPEKNN